jgi:hypothetical protein
MDIEKTIQFILNTQSRTESTLAKSAEWQAKVERKQDATIKMIKAGMKILGQQDNGIKQLTVSLKGLTVSLNALEHSAEELAHSVGDLRFSHQALIDAQMRTDEKLNRFIDSLSKQRSNGH